jgi:hypothetical protein
MRRLILTVAIATATFTTATAQTFRAVPDSSVCGKRSAVLERLAQNYGEGLTAYGINRVMNWAVEIYVSKKSRSFTVLKTDVKGKTCIVISGDNFEGFKTPNKPPYKKSRM